MEGQLIGSKYNSLTVRQVQQDEDPSALGSGAIAAIHGFWNLCEFV